MKDVANEGTIQPDIQGCIRAAGTCPTRMSRPDRMSSSRTGMRRTHLDTNENSRYKDSRHLNCLLCLDSCTSLLVLRPHCAAVTDSSQREWSFRLLHHRISFSTTMSGTTDPAIGSTHYADDAFKGRKSPKRRDSERKDSAQDDYGRRNYSLSRIPSSRGSSASRNDSPERRPRRRSDADRRGRYSRDWSRSPSPRRYEDEQDDPEKPWFKKKTLWATVASIASVASVAAVSMSTQATRESAKATRTSAEATKKSALATQNAALASHRSADASNRIANGNDLSTRAVVNTAVAAGHQDHRGRYLGPPPREGARTPRARRLSWDRIANGKEPGQRRRSRDRRSHHSRSSAGHSHRSHRPHVPAGLLEYHPVAKVPT